MPQRPGKKGKGKAKAKGAAGPSHAAGGGADGGGDAAPRVWMPGVDGMEADEELQYDPSTYDCLHALQLEWPCLSVDPLRDARGERRAALPHDLVAVAGSQADVAANNRLTVFKLSNVASTRRRAEGDADEDDSEEESSDDDTDDEMAEASGAGGGRGNAKAPRLSARAVPHAGGVNRVRAMPQMSGIVAAWGDTGYVQVFDVTPAVEAVEADAGEPTTREGGLEGHKAKTIALPPLAVYKGHGVEGYAMDWAPTVVGRLLTGDCNGGLHLWEPREGGGWAMEANDAGSGGSGFVGHQASVEDLQWSPCENGVFASCSADRSIKIWDVRQRAKPALSVAAHDDDVNVISWSPLATPMLASGGDDGRLRVWDLRSFSDGAFVANFAHHRAPITSVGWSPWEAAMLSAAAADNTLTVWDLSLERDTEAEAAMAASTEQADAPDDLPPQLLFVHQGQTNIKEVRWHPQCVGLMLSTAADGINAFKPITC